MFDIIPILQSVRKKITRNDILLVTILIVLFLVTRLINLDKFPIFGDEGIYIRWAKVAWHDASWRFISLTDGKQPLQTWGTIPFLKLFPHNALLAGRLFSVATGFFALSGMISLCLYLFGKRAAFIGGLLYVFTPMFLFYDKMALVDSGVNAFAIWIFLFSFILAQTIRLDVALLFGLMSGMALLAKSSVRIFLGLGYLALITIKPSRRRIINFSILYFLSCIIALIFYNVQRLSPFFHFVAEKNKTFIVTPSEFLTHPLAHFFDNIPLVQYYVFSEVGYVIGIIGLIGLYYLWKKDKRLGVYFGLWIIIPYLIIAFVSKVIFPRYLIFFGSILTILAAYLLGQLHDIKKIVVAGVLIFLSVGFFDYTILYNYKNIPFPDVDKGQYVEGVTAGWGVPEIVAYAREKSKEKPVILMAEGDFGVIGDQLDVFLYSGDKIELQGYWPLDEKQLIEGQNFLKDHVVYVVFSHRTDFPQNWPIKLVKKYEKPGSKSAIYFFELEQPSIKK